MAHDVGMDSLLDQCRPCRGLDEAVNSLRGQALFLVWPMLPQGLEEGMSGLCSISGGLQIILDGEEGPGVQGNAPKPPPLPHSTVKFPVPDPTPLVTLSS